MAPTCVVASLSVLIIFCSCSFISLRNVVNSKYSCLYRLPACLDTRGDVYSSVNMCKYDGLSAALVNATRFNMAHRTRQRKFSSARSSYYHNFDSTFNEVLNSDNLQLLLSGDIHTNPGPATADVADNIQPKSHTAATTVDSSSQSHRGHQQLQYTSFHLRGLRFVNQQSLQTTVMDTISYFGLNKRRPRGRRAGQSVQRRAAMARSMTGRHIVN